MFDPPVRVKHKSKWAFETSGTGGVGIEFVAASGGTVVLLDPTGAERRVHYGAGGVGLSAGIRKIPKIGRIDPGKLDPKGFSDHGGGNVAPESFWNHGAVYVMEGCPREELQLDDFTGICLAFDVGAGLIVGYSGSAILAGIDPASLVFNVALRTNPIGGLFAPPLRYRALILSRGWNVGPQASAGVTGQIGYMWH